MTYVSFNPGAVLKSIVLLYSRGLRFQTDRGVSAHFICLVRPPYDRQIQPGRQVHIDRILNSNKVTGHNTRRYARE